MYMVIKYFSFLVFPLSISLAFLGIPIEKASAESETLTLTTYYPAPYGVYKELSTDELVVGLAEAVSDEFGAMQEGEAHIGTALIVGKHEPDHYSYRNIGIQQGEIITERGIAVGRPASPGDVGLYVGSDFGTAAVFDGTLNVTDTITYSGPNDTGVSFMNSNTLDWAAGSRIKGYHNANFLEITPNSSDNLNGAVNIDGAQLNIRGVVRNFGGDVIIDDNLNVTGSAMIGGSLEAEGDVNARGRLNAGNGFEVVGRSHIRSGLTEGLYVEGNILASRNVDADNFGAKLKQRLNDWLLASMGIIIFAVIAAIFGSSQRYKENIKTITDPIEKVMKLRGVEFDWKENKKHDMGMIAEEVGATIPEIVEWEENKKDARLLYSHKLVGLLVEAIKEQQKQIEALKEKVDALSAAPAAP